MIIAARNEFKKDLAYSMELKSDKAFDELYYKAFPGLKLITFETDLVEQKKGIDKRLLFETGKIITIDEKKRKKDYGDILLEIISNTKTQKPGWLITCQCDYIVYFIEPSRTAYLLPVLFLKMAWEHNKSSWIKQYKIIEAENPGYKTKSICIPITVLMAAIAKEMKQEY